MCLGEDCGLGLKGFFSYGGIDTTNHVKRHWELIKYTLLQWKVNRSLRDLIVTIIGSAKDGTRLGQP